MADSEGSPSAGTKTPPPPPPKLGRGLSKQYSIYPRKLSLNTIRGAVTGAIDIIKFLYTNDFTR